MSTWGSTVRSRSTYRRPATDAAGGPDWVKPVAVSTRPLTARAIWLAVGLVTGWLPTGCRRDLPVAVTPRDSMPPALQVVFPDPDSTAFDRDSDGLMDLVLRWTDSAGAVNPATLRVTAVQGGVPGVPADSNLLPGWRVVRLDTAGAVLEETVAELLREGATRLAISVADAAGNRVTGTTAVIHLPPGAHHRAISLSGLPACERERGVNLALSPDGKKGFVPFNGCVAVFDPDGVQPVHFISPVTFAGFAADISLDTSTGLAYIGGGPGRGISVLDTRTEQVVRSWTYPTGVANVQALGGRLFVGQSCTDGSIDVYDLQTLAKLGTVVVGAPYLNSVCPNVNDVALGSDERDGWAVVINTGIVHFDLQTYTMISLMRLDSGGCGGECWGQARSIRLVDDRWLEAADPCTHLWEYDTQPWHLSLQLGDPTRAQPCYSELALSPDGSSLFVSSDSTGQLFVDSVQTPYLFDVPGLRLRYAFPHRRGATPDAAVWHPDGKRVYMMDGFQVDVYIVRPRPS